MTTLPLKNPRWVVSGLLAAQLLLLLNFAFGAAKPFATIDWLDIAGEGGTSLFVFAWWWFLVSGRPAGRVSNFLIAGLLLLFLGTFQDAIDEVIKISGAGIWLNNLEAVYLLLGMIILTIGLFLWRDEQRVIQQQLHRREGFFRDHRTVDGVTQLADIHYLKQHLHIALANANNKNTAFSLLLVDIDNFHIINREYGYDEGDRLLQATAELLELTLRHRDLLCRFAGDRYALLLDNADETQARQLLRDSLNLVNHYHFRTLLGERIALNLSGGLATYRKESAEQLLQRAKLDLLKEKDKRQPLAPYAA